MISHQLHGLNITQFIKSLILEQSKLAFGQSRSFWYGPCCPYNWQKCAIYILSIYQIGPILASGLAYTEGWLGEQYTQT